MRRAAVVWLLATFCCAGADPVLQFSTYLGGKGREPSAQVAVAPDGAVWIAMATNSTDLPVSPDAVQTAVVNGLCTGDTSLQRPCSDIYIAKISPAGEILRSTYFGGLSEDTPTAIQLDTAGNVWVAGTTGSMDLPQALYVGNTVGTSPHMFAARLSPDLRAVQLCSVANLGSLTGFAVDTSGSAYLAGADTVTKLTPSGDMAWSISLGPDVRFAALALDAAGRPIVAGNTEGADLAGGGARYGQRSGGYDAFVAKLSVDGKSLFWARYLGDSGPELLGAMAQDRAGNLWLGGTTVAGRWFDTATGGFLTEVSSDGATILADRGLSHDVGAIAVDASGSLWLTGTCCFSGFKASPTALQAARNGYSVDGYLLKLDTGGATVWASYIGGSHEDRGTAVASTADGVVLAGVTQSFDFPLNHAAQMSLHQQPDASPVNEDVFLMRFGAAPFGEPSVRSGGIVNVAGYRVGEAAPGSTVSIFGGDLALAIRPFASFPLPTSLASTAVTVNGVAAPLFYVSPSQINAQIPWETAAGPAEIEIRRGDSVSAVQKLAIAPVSPGLFVDYRGWAAINSPSYSYLQAGDWLTLYATGLGAVDRPPANGAAPAALSLLVTPPTVTIGSMPLEVTWAGLAPGLIGVYQVNARLPADMGVGYRYEPLVITVGGRSSNSGLVGLAGRLN